MEKDNKEEVVDMNQNEDNSYSFIEETIRPKKKVKLRKLLSVVGIAVLFGTVSSLTFCASFSYLSDVFGIERLTVSLGGNDGIPSETIEPTATPGIAPSTSPSLTAESTPIVQQPIIEQYIERVPADLTDVNSIYYELNKLASKVNTSIVTVTSVQNGVNVFQAPYEKTSSTSGIIIANNGRELLILVSKDRIMDAKYLRVTFKEGSTFDATMYNTHEELGLAIVAVKVVDMPYSLVASCKEVKLGESFTLSAGDPVMALGNPNGYMYSVDVGMVTNEVVTAYITDCKVELFNTNIRDNSNGDGVIINMQGEVVGFITREFKQELNRNINTCLGVSKIKAILEKMINQEPLMYCGIKAQDITSEVAKKLDVNVGVYVTDVEVQSPAFNAGIRKSDIIYKMNDTVISNMYTFFEQLCKFQNQEVVTFTVIRNVSNTQETIEVPITVQSQ